MESTHGETAEDLLAAAAAHGHQVTPVMLKRWRDRGLLPRPRQRSRGRGRGTETVYPMGTIDHLLRLLAIRAEGGRFAPERALWQLWWEGWPVEPEQVRVLLQATLAAWERALSAVANDDGAGVDAFGADRLASPLAKVRKRTGTAAMPTVAALVLGLLAGKAPARWQDADDAPTLLQALGLREAVQSLAPDPGQFSADLAETLRRFGEAVAPAALRDALEAAGDTDLAQAWTDLRAIVSAVRTFWPLVAPLLSGSNAGRDLLALRTAQAAALLPGAVLVCLALRRHPTYAKLLDLCHQASAGAVALAQAIAADPATTMKKPHRRGNGLEAGPTERNQ